MRIGKVNYVLMKHCSVLTRNSQLTTYSPLSIEINPLVRASARVRWRMCVCASVGMRCGLTISDYMRRVRVHSCSVFVRDSPNTIQITMLFPIIAMNSIPPNKIVHKAFCSTEISYGRTGGDFKQSLMKSLQTNKQNYIKKLTIFSSPHIFRAFSSP